MSAFLVLAWMACQSYRGLGKCYRVSFILVIAFSQQSVMGFIHQVCLGSLPLKSFITRYSQFPIGAVQVGIHNQQYSPTSSLAKRRCKYSIPQSRPFAFPSLRMSAAKTGGRLISSADDYSQYVVEADDAKPVLVFWTAPWCGPCRLSIPVVKEVMKQLSSRVDLVEVCTDDFPEVAADAGVVSIPTIQMYFRGKLLDTIIGCVAKTVLASAVEKVLEEISIDLERRGGPSSPSVSRTNASDFDANVQ